MKYIYIQYIYLYQLYVISYWSSNVDVKDSVACAHLPMKTPSCSHETSPFTRDSNNSLLSGLHFFSEISAFSEFSAFIQGIDLAV